MPLAIPTGATVFLDANILYYALVSTPPFSEPVYELMDRLIAGDVIGAASIQVLADAQHKTMLSLLAQEYGLTRSNLVGWAKKHPDKLGCLTSLEQVVDLVQSASVRVLPLDDYILLREAASYTSKYGLLTNDALIVALMQRYKFTNLASNDNDFDRVPGIQVWKPRA